MNQLTSKNYVFYIFVSSIFLFFIGTVNAQQPSGSQTVTETDIVGSMNFPQRQQNDYPSYQPLNVDDIDSDAQIEQFESDYEVSRQNIESYKNDGSFYKLKKLMIDKIKSNRAGVGNRGNQDNASPNDANGDSSENDSQANNSQENNDEDKNPDTSGNTENTGNTTPDKKPESDTAPNLQKRLKDKLFATFKNKVDPSVIESIVKIGDTDLMKHILNNPEKIAQLDKETQRKIAKKPEYLLEVLK